MRQDGSQTWFGSSVAPLAVPLTLFLIVVVEVLYVEQELGEPASSPGPPEPPYPDARPGRFWHTVADYWQETPGMT